MNGDTAQFVGGILGYVYNSNFTGLQNCLNMGSVTGGSYVGSIIGWARDYNTNTITNNYYLKTARRVLELTNSPPKL